ncbi:hypothetical protein [Flavobacterium sp.]|jgi:hypothetical protein|uniref:hypothetical protein n=1 Tax=Flavobacterium sp. TaxID=239 RepID=UPI0037BF0550
MKEVPQFILSVLIGFSVLILSFGYVEREKSAQKIENIERLIRTKDYLSTKKSIQETDLLLEEMQRKIDSMK